ncbi:hypothetical protein LIER_21860 [Lithospermum erythrorhizon]|uniref:Reverse transcriptase Ty1/copia-type domain-containing protein n=1 Tax=Lithospermum erythrorhizon TaxID=34254 RepID=A0AAV3QRX8_LITER
MDMHNAFLHGDLSEEIYMKFPPGFNMGRPGRLCKLHKSLYGLKHAPNCWFSKFAMALKRYGFVQSYSNYSQFAMCKGKILGAKLVGFPMEQNQRLTTSTSTLLKVGELIIVFLADSPVSSKSKKRDTMYQSSVEAEYRSMVVAIFFHDRTKHIEIDFEFLLDAVLDGTVRLSHVPTTNQLADIFTKALETVV